MIDITDLIGVRFCNHGRSIKEGFDCYGLAIEVSKRKGHILPDLWYLKSTNETFSENADSILSEMKGTLKETREQQESNLVVFFENKRMVHIGVILEENRFIHCDKYGVKVELLSEYYRKDWRIYKWLH